MERTVRVPPPLDDIDFKEIDLARFREHIRHRRSRAYGFKPDPNRKEEVSELPPMTPEQIKAEDEYAKKAYEDHINPTPEYTRRLIEAMHVMYVGWAFGLKQPEDGLTDTATPKENHTKLGLWLKMIDVIQRRGLSNVELGEVLGISGPHLSDLMTGLARKHSIGELKGFLTSLRSATPSNVQE